MKKKLVLLFASMLLGSSLLVGCGGTAPAKEEPVKEEVEKPEEPTGTPTFDWSDSELVSHIPLPDTETTSVEIDTEEDFWVYINGNEDKYNEYVEKCKEYGYDIVDDEWEGHYRAWNKEGYHIAISLDGTQYCVELRTSYTNKDLSWPGYGLATMVPNPEKEKGTILVDGALNFSAVVGDISKEEFNAYVDKVMELGFNLEYSRNEKCLDANNEAGDSVFLLYEPNNSMEISIYKAEALDDSF